MALFKLLRGQESDLANQPLHDGYVWVTKDLQNMWFDYYDETNTLVRKRINSEFADKLRYIKNGETVELDPSEIATHAYVQSAIAGKANTSHTHDEFDEISDTIEVLGLEIDGIDDLNVKNTNPITTPADDTTANWIALGNGIYWYDTLGQLIDQPCQYFFILNIVYGADVMQIISHQNKGMKYYRSGNRDGWHSSWIRLIDETGAAFTGTVDSSVQTASFRTGNSGKTIINSTAPAGDYVMLDKLNSTNGYFTDGVHGKKRVFQYTSQATVGTGENKVDSSVTLLDEDGNSSFPGVVTADGLMLADGTDIGVVLNEHTHNYAGSDSAGGSANRVKENLTIKLNGGTTEGTNKYTFNGSAAYTIDIAPSSIGAATSTHYHDERYYTEVEIDNKVSILNTSIDGLRSTLDGKANTSHSHNDIYYTETEVDTKLDNKVDKVTGKGLSTNDYTTAEKNKLAGIEAGANKYVLPSATDSVVGGMKLYTATGSNTAGTMTQKAITDALSGKSGTGHNHDSVYSKLGHTHTAADVGATTETYVDNQIAAAKSYTDTKVAGLVDSAPDTLNTLNELAAALGDDPNFATTMATELGKKATNTELNTHTGNTTVHITSTERTNWNAAKTHADSAHAPSNAERNIIVGIQKNGTDVSVNSSTRKVNITVPTKTSELTNNSDFATNASVSNVKDELQANIDGKAASSHNHAASNITSGTLSSDRLPTVPVAKGGTGATTAAGALTNLGLTATAAELNVLDGVTATTTELNYVDGVTSNIQTQLNGKAPTDHTHSMSTLTGHSIELNQDGSLSGFGGFLDFHYNGSSSDYTSRIIENGQGNLSINGVSCNNKNIACSAIDITNGATKNKTSGYVKLNNGIILQWGTVADLANGNSKWVTFPIAFPTAVGGTPMLTGNYGNSFGYELHANDVAATGFTIVKRGGSSTTGTDTVSWLAVGW